MRRNVNNRGRARIRVVGIGGGGGNAVNRMISAKLKGVEFMTVDTDAHCLEKSLAATRLQIGETITRGLGTGGRLEKGAHAAYLARYEIEDALRGADLIFVTTAMGGGTGAGASPVVAEIARESGIFTIAIVTRPFYFEGPNRTQMAKEGIQQLAEQVDALIVFPNDRLLSLSNERTSLKKAFSIADDLLRRGVQTISDFINVPGLINLDFANLKSVTSRKGATLVTTGYARGFDRARLAAEQAMLCPILGLKVNGARGMLVNITAAPDLNLQETQEVTKLLKNAIRPGADFTFGTVIDEKMGDGLRVSVIATGFYNEVWNEWSLPEMKRGGVGTAVPAPQKEPAKKMRPAGPDQTSRLNFSFRNFTIPAFLQSG